MGGDGRFERHYGVARLLRFDLPRDQTGGDILAEQVADARAQDVLFSIHLKATMMKVSDPIMFGHCVRAYYRDVFEKHDATFREIGVDANNGIGDVYAKIADLPDDKRAQIETDLQAVYETRPPQAMVDSDKGITNLHVPSDIIVDASMPAMLRSSGKVSVSSCLSRISTRVGIRSSLRTSLFVGVRGNRTWPKRLAASAVRPLCSTVDSLLTAFL